MATNTSLKDVIIIICKQYISCTNRIQYEYLSFYKNYKQIYNSNNDETFEKTGSPIRSTHNQIKKSPTFMYEVSPTTWHGCRLLNSNTIWIVNDLQTARWHELQAKPWNTDDKICREIFICESWKTEKNWTQKLSICALKAFVNGR